MNPRKNTFLILLLGLLLVAFSAVAAQTPSQGEQKKKTESCCQMESCCTDDSCDMKKHDAKMKHDKDAKGECCNMKNKDKNKKKDT